MEEIKSEFIYMKIDKHRKRVVFYENWDEARKTKGVKRKYKRTHRSSMLNQIGKTMGQYPTKSEIDSWELPKWIKEWLYKKTKQEIYITRVGSTIFFKYADESKVEVIKKHRSFEYFYSFDYYIYDILMKMSEYNDIKILYVYTDIAEILRLNRIYYDRDLKNKIIVKLRKYSDLYKVMGGE